MPESLFSLFITGAGTLTLVGKCILIFLFFTAAWLVHRSNNRLASRIIRFGRFTPRHKQMRAERHLTLQSLLASGISIVIFVIVIFSSLALFVDFDSLLWVIGLFTAGFGLAARPVISDFLTGVSFIFEDTFDVGEKVEILGVEGVIEAVNLRTSTLRAPTGELYIVPNGEIRLIRNFSRGRFSTVKITLKLVSEELGVAIPILEDMANEAVLTLPNLLEPWQLISETGVIGQNTELTLIAKARYGLGAEMRPRLLALVQEKLTEENIQLVD
ncbi:MAG: mechanosensitive ion channel domain-containing protein [Candidatus Promineifilaceae bacterium]